MFYYSSPRSVENSRNNRKMVSRHVSNTPQTSKQLTPEKVNATSNMTYYRSDETSTPSFSVTIPSNPSLFVEGIKKTIPKDNVNIQRNRTLMDNESKNIKTSSTSNTMRGSVEFVKSTNQNKDVVKRPLGPFHELF